MVTVRNFVNPPLVRGDFSVSIYDTEIHDYVLWDTPWHKVPARFFPYQVKKISWHDGIPCLWI